MATWRCRHVVIRNGSTEWMRNGSMIVRNTGALMPWIVLPGWAPVNTNPAPSDRSGCRTTTAGWGVRGGDLFALVLDTIRR